VRFYVIRHSQPDYGDDPENPPEDPGLTPDGREWVSNLAQWMLETEEIPNSFLVSPKLRCQETAEILRDALGLPASAVQTKASMDSDMSIRKMVLKACADKSMTRVAIVSHHESIEHGLRVLNLESQARPDMLAMAELRILKVDRKDGTWKDHNRVFPSDLGGRDHY
jgi:phosphohistidine phosphatase SixA